MIERLMRQRRYLAAVDALNSSLAAMFHEVITSIHIQLIRCSLSNALHCIDGQDMVDVEALTGHREQLMELKGRVLDGIVAETRRVLQGERTVQDRTVQYIRYKTRGSGFCSDSKSWRTSISNLT